MQRIITYRSEVQPFVYHEQLLQQYGRASLVRRDRLEMVLCSHLYTEIILIAVYGRFRHPLLSHHKINRYTFSQYKLVPNQNQTNHYLSTISETEIQVPKVIANDSRTSAKKCSESVTDRKGRAVRQLYTGRDLL